MRIDGLSNNTSSIKNNVDDLLGRLDTGDVIKAKVLDSTSDEVVLRLFDGSVIKAAAGEALEAKAGQTLTLMVTSRSEGTLYLETLKEPQTESLKPDSIKNMLEALGVKPNAANTNLAAEFVKAGITPDTTQFQRAMDLMKSFRGLSAEKAVFIVSKGIRTEPANLDILSKLLDGELKVGTQLNALKDALNLIRQGSVKSQTSDTVSRTGIQELSAGSGPAKAELSGSFGTTVSGSTDNRVNMHETPSGENALKTNGAGRQGMIGTPHAAAGMNHTVHVPEAPPEQTTAPLTPASGKQPSDNKTAASETTPAPASSTQDRNTPAVQAQANTSAAQQTDNDYRNQIPVLRENTNQIERNTQDEYSENVLKDKNGGNPSPLNENRLPIGKESISAPQQNGISPEDFGITCTLGGVREDSFIQLEESIKNLFVDTDSEQLASDLNVNKLQTELNEKLDTLRDTFQGTDTLVSASGKNILSVAETLNQSVKITNQLHQNNMLYFQIPVNMSGYNTTAELYVMKRRQNQRKIDPHNSVLFVSLDTNSLGRIETLLDVKGSQVSISLRTEKEPINDFIRENIKHLYSGLSNCGYKLVEVHYSVMDRAATPLKQEQLLSKMLEMNHGKVDLRI